MEATVSGYPAFLQDIPSHTVKLNTSLKLKKARFNNKLLINFFDVEATLRVFVRATEQMTDIKSEYENCAQYETKEFDQLVPHIT